MDTAGRIGKELVMHSLGKQKFPRIPIDFCCILLSRVFLIILGRLEMVSGGHAAALYKDQGSGSEL